ncbi:hypothetical protein KKB55_19725 [Myxococcota bacterium]|nr:hypothetical protein [Myxococcota bacterium]MBU1899978.1 hypothetical protein [Myxococcota bacterium]
MRAEVLYLLSRLGLLAALLAWGCDDKGPSLSYCHEYAKARCELWYRCFDVEELKRLEGAYGFTEATCDRVLDSRCGETHTDKLNLGWQTYTAKEAMACLDELKAQECAPLYSYKEPLSCRLAIDGKFTFRDPCESSWDCAGLDARCNFSWGVYRSGEQTGEGRCTVPLTPLVFQQTCTSKDVAHCETGYCISKHDEEEEASNPPHGVCTVPCDFGMECGEGSYCQSIHVSPCSDCASYDINICLAGCETDADCDNGLRCATVSGTEKKGCYFRDRL